MYRAPAPYFSNKVTTGGGAMDLLRSGTQT
jgi:hypothetical protein